MQVPTAVCPPLPPVTVRCYEPPCPISNSQVSSARTGRQQAGLRAVCKNNCKPGAACCGAASGPAHHNGAHHAAPMPQRPASRCASLRAPTSLRISEQMPCGSVIGLEVVVSALLTKQARRCEGLRHQPVARRLLLASRPCILHHASTQQPGSHRVLKKLRLYLLPAAQPLLGSPQALDGRQPKLLLQLLEVGPAGGRMWGGTMEK